jgi:hypothetical protein
MEHVVVLDRDDTVVIKFAEFPNMALPILYKDAWEALLNAELVKLRKEKNEQEARQLYGQNIGLAAQQTRY